MQVEAGYVDAVDVVEIIDADAVEVVEDSGGVFYDSEAEDTEVVDDVDPAEDTHEISAGDEEAEEVDDKYK